MTNNKFVKIVIPYFTEHSIELYLRDNLIPTDLEMIRFKALNCLASEKNREEIITDLNKFLNLVGIETFDISQIKTVAKIQEFPILL
jgi:hypothetical protein